MDAGEYLREREEDEILPWEKIDARLGRDFLLRERRRAREGKTTPVCDEGCRRCALCGDEFRVIRRKAERKETAPAPPPAPPGEKPEARHRLRFRFTKLGDWRFLSHLETGRAIRFALRRSGLPVAYTLGFHPHVRVAFGPALPVGVGGRAELVDLLLHDPVPPAEAERRLNAELPHGIRLFHGREVPLRSRALDSFTFRMEYEARLPEGEDPERLERRIGDFLARDSVPADRVAKGRTKTIDLRPGVYEARVDREEGTILFAVRTGAPPAELLRWWAEGDESRALSWSLTRTALDPIEEKEIEREGGIG